MFLLDDVLLRSIGYSLPGLDMFWLFEQVLYFSHKEIHDLVKDKIKENRLLYEFGEISDEVYQRNNAVLTRRLKLAERAKEMNLGVRADVLGS